MLEKNRALATGLLLGLAVALLSMNCAGKKNLTLQDVESFYRMTGAEDRSPADCDRFFRRNLRPGIKLQFPAVLERTYQFTGKSAYSLQELRGMLRYALLENAVKARTMESAKTALELLVPALEGMGAEKSTLYTRIKSAADPVAFDGLAKALIGDLTEICLKDIEALRTRNSLLAEKRLVDLRFLVLSLPEGESEVVNITRIVWDELDSDVNDIQLDKVRELLRGAYPALVL